MVRKMLSRWIDCVVEKTLRCLWQNPRRILRDYVKAGMTVLDVGCGAGFFSLGMARMVGPDGRVVCVDLQTDAVKSLEGRAAEAGLSERIDTRVCNDRSLEVDDLAGQVDFALAFYVVHHASDVPALMTQVYDALKLGGTFLIVEPEHHASAEVCEATQARAQQAGFAFVDSPRMLRAWAALFVKNSAAI